MLPESGVHLAARREGDRPRADTSIRDQARPGPSWFVASHVSDLNSELDRLRAAVADKRARNEKLQQQVQAARAELAAGGGQAPPAPKPDSALTAGGHNDRGMVLFREKHYEQAAAEFQQAVKMNPSHALFANNLGFVYYRMNDAAHAAEWFEKTLALDPKRAIAYANLGDAYLALGRKPDARKAYEKYLEMQPNAKYATTVRQKLEQVR